LWEKIYRRNSHKKLFGQVWENSGKNPSHPKNFACSCTCGAKKDVIHKKWVTESSYVKRDVLIFYKILLEYGTVRMLQKTKIYESLYD